MPYQILQEANLSKDVTCELAALQCILVHVGQSYRVRIGVTLAYLSIVVAEYVVDGDIGQSGQRVVDDTLATIGTLQVIVGGRECGRHTQLEPRLELCVEVGTYRVTLEVRTYDGTLLIHEVTRNIVLHLIGTALSRELMLMLESGLEDSILPVSTLTQDRRVRVVLVSLTLNNPTIVYKVLIIFCILAQVHHIKTLNLTVNCKHTIVVETSLARLTTLSSNQYNTIGTLCTIDSGSRGVLKDFH